MTTKEFKEVLQERFTELMNSFNEENTDKVDEEIRAITQLYRVLEKNYNL